MKDGGSAFPEIETDKSWHDGDPYDHTYSYGGMTLRDYFAAKALQGFCSSIGIMTITEISDRIIGGKPYVQAAYALADKMLELREPQGQP